MKNFKTIFFVFTFFSLMISCGYVKTTTVPKYFKFKKESTFCITTSNSNFKDKIIMELSYGLENLGLNTVSEINAKKAMSLKLKPDFKYKTNDIEEIISIKDFNSIYEIRIQYKEKSIDPSNDFKAWIIDMNDNKVVLQYINSNEKSLEYIINSFEKKIFEKTDKN